MGTRALVSLCIVGAVSYFARSALADVPNPTGSGGSTGSVLNPDCTVSLESTNGRTCQECDPTASCNFGSDYHMFCNRTAHAQVWCNGPLPDVAPTQNVSCAASSTGSAAWGGAAAGALAVAAALSMIRRRR
jgi:MYXO-CTERM domain-containing protein